jgi:hypothetical protein
MNTSWKFNPVSYPPRLSALDPRSNDRSILLYTGARRSAVRGEAPWDLIMESKAADYPF